MYGPKVKGDLFVHQLESEVTRARVFNRVLSVPLASARALAAR